mmetsp:Transcript_50730/g.115334  ORF Transcript_50730/g.115334 Transcript_50730/m.115334 type:complete len:222 (+) Transcript_50730:261-926(+)
MLASLALRRSSNPRLVGDGRFGGESPICMGAVELGLSRGCSSTRILFLKARPFTGIRGLGFRTSPTGAANGADDTAACRRSGMPRKGDSDLDSAYGAEIPSGGPIDVSRSGSGGLLSPRRAASPAGRATSPVRRAASPAGRTASAPRRAASPAAVLTIGRSGRTPNWWPLTIRAAARLADSAKAMLTRSIWGHRSRGISTPSPPCLLCQCCSFFSMTSWNT